MADFDPSKLKSTSWEDATPEFIFTLAEKEKQYVAVQNANNPDTPIIVKIRGVFNSETETFDFSGSIPVKMYIGDDGKVKYDAVEYLPTLDAM